MFKADVITHFRSGAAAARAIGVGRAAVSSWGPIVPPLRAAQYHKVTKGKLKFDPADYSDWYWKQTSESPAVE